MVAFLVILIILATQTTAELRSAVFLRQQYRPGPSLSLLTGTVSPVKCAADCLDRSDCVSYVYTNLKNECELFSVNSGIPVPDTAYNNHFFKVQTPTTTTSTTTTAPPTTTTTPTTTTIPTTTTTPSTTTIPTTTTTPTTTTIPTTTTTPSTTTIPTTTTTPSTTTIPTTTTAKPATMDSPCGTSKKYNFVLERDSDWFVIARRTDGSVNFDKTFDEYDLGFGQQPNNFYIGNGNVAEMTNECEMTMRILVTIDGEESDCCKFARFSLAYSQYYTFNAVTKPAVFGEPPLPYGNPLEGLNGYGFYAKDKDTVYGTAVSRGGGLWCSEAGEASVNLFGRYDDTLIWTDGDNTVQRPTKFVWEIKKL